MSTAIRATNSKNIRVTNSSFSGFETDIELDNVVGFISEKNKFSGENNPQLLLDNLMMEIRVSKLDNSTKQRLLDEIMKYLTLKQGDKNSTQKKILMYFGNKAADYFIQLAAAVSAGLLIHK